MAEFEIANDAVHKHEVGYSNHSSDRGGETYDGVARAYWPGWRGWAYVDTMRDLPGFPANISKYTIQPHVDRFYKKNFWRPIHGDTIHSQLVATQLYDMAVHSGPRMTVRRLQNLLNLLNRQERDYDDLTVDGVMGYNTSSTLNHYVKSRSNGEYILGLYLLAEAGHLWIELAEKDETQEDFMNGWGARGVDNLMRFAKDYLSNENENV